MMEPVMPRAWRPGTSAQQLSEQPKQSESWRPSRRVQASPDGDTFLPDFAPEDWREVARESHAADADVPAYSFVTLERIRQA